MRRRDFIKVVGSITVWPLVAQAQQPGTPVIGFLSSRSPDESKHVLAAFHKGLSDAGLIEGTNVAVEYQMGTRRISEIAFTGSRPRKAECGGHSGGRR